jgi:hypothetical protein
MKTSFLILFCLSTVSSFAASLRYRGTYQGEGEPLIVDAYLDQTHVSSNLPGPYLPRIELQVVICEDHQAGRRRFLELVGVEPLDDRAAFKNIGSPHAKDLELTYSSKWQKLDGQFSSGDGLGTSPPRLTLERFNSNIAQCADEPTPPNP